MAGGGKGAELLTRIGLAAASVGPPAVLGAKFWSSAAAHPVAALLLFLAYEAALAAVAFAAKVYGKVADRWVDRAADAVDRRLKWRISRVERDYRAYVLRHHRFIDLKGLATRGDYTPGLEEVFVDVSLVPRPAHEASQEPLAGPVLWPLPGGTDGGVPVRRSIREFIGRPEGAALAVIGAPGTGKTTMLKHLALGLARERGGRGRRDLPVLLLLRDHAGAITANPALTLPEVIGASLRRPPDDELPGWFDRQLQDGRCVVLLDGLDEVAREEDRRNVSKWVEEQIEQYEPNDFVLTSRPHGYASAPVNRARVLQVRRFTGEQITRFVHGWYRAIERLSTGTDDAAVADRAEEGARDLLARLHARPVLYDLAANPLLLTMIANVHRYRGALPGSRAELYGEICEVLLWRRQEAKGATAAPDELSGAKKELVARELAYVMMADRLRDIRGEYASEVLRPVLLRVAATMSSREFLEAMAASGLLVERERGLYAFAHLTLQEHLAALHIQHRGLVDVLVAGVDDDWWRETTLLYAARVDPAPVVEACLAEESLTINKLALAFDCEEEATELAPATAVRLGALRHQLMEGPVDSPRRRLMTGVTLARSLRQAVRLGEDTLVCARPVTKEVYRLFAAERDTPAAPGLTDGPADDVAVGMTRTEAVAFVRWVNARAGGEFGYRLPTRAEAEDEAFGLVLGPGDRPVWCQDDPGAGPDAPPLLWVPDGAGHPWAVPAGAADGAWLGRSGQDDIVFSEGSLGLARAISLRTDVGGGDAVGFDVAYELRAGREVRLIHTGMDFPDIMAQVRAGGVRINLTGVEAGLRLLDGEFADLGFPARVEWATRCVALLYALGGPVDGNARSATTGDSFEERCIPLLSGLGPLTVHRKPHFPDICHWVAADCAGRLDVLPPGDVPEPLRPTIREVAEFIASRARVLAEAPHAMDPADGPYLRIAALTMAAVMDRFLPQSVLADAYREVAAGFLALQRRADGTAPPTETLVLVRA
ncbi:MULTISPECIES: NACHT domain-containing protein [unclassified Streptomyces]|uniref:NACHT domain-containing protein n=1 Tax=unclassified Streptomyces TaxID=2593676 RepID=UPI00336A14C8